MIHHSQETGKFQDAVIIRAGSASDLVDLESMPLTEDVVTPSDEGWIKFKELQSKYWHLISSRIVLLYFGQLRCVAAEHNAAKFEPGTLL